MSRQVSLAGLLALARYLHRPETWQHDAACLNQWGITDTTTPPASYAALDLCRDCPVIDQCAAWAGNHPGYHGVAGGHVRLPNRPDDHTTTDTDPPAGGGRGCVA